MRWIRFGSAGDPPAGSPAAGPAAVRPPGRRRYWAALLMLLSIVPAHSQTNPDLDRIRADIARLRRRLEDVRAQTQTAERELEAVDLELGIRSGELDIALRIEADLEQQQRDTEGQIAALAAQIQQQKTFLTKRLVALYRLGGLSYIRLLLSINGRRDPIEAMSMLTYLASRDSRAISHFDATQQQFRARSAELSARQRNVAEARKIIEQRRQAVAVTFARKQRLVALLRREGSQSEQQIATLEEKAVRLERLIDVLSRQNAGVVTAEDIRTVQGALSWPVTGKIVEAFGRQMNPKFATVTFNNGLKIAASPGTEVRAIFPGTVLFSQWFKGYGNLIILDHGNRVFSLYGNLKSPAVAVGDRIRAGQAIAGVGEAEEAQLGYLYFEIRQDNKPEDPQTWLR
jgi:septal ring factor EnvC (AmiA/AmiB activator)